ncbi:hypothetical protein BGI41_02010 [Methanobrevibacter sp. 87.7]|uniref:glycosyltransferase family 2 protein n=1 Tax=Methanobrevibacter sp. 87.7 TaxID=387957 RepID=UPI000B50F8CA|nr:glycosyltransferase family 2 protein [Methanobrevibacter sp. 87.7]OWT33514.1 hypothetical protein BGI41_02010 [Methanobrevibacter sp. 87.7]
MYKISVIVPIYNREKYLNRCIDSVINQTIGFENIELFLIDDNSTDKSKSIIKSYGDKYDNIKCFYFSKNNGVPGPLRDIALDNATGKYVMFLDSDDYYKDNFCEVMFNAIDGTKFNIVESKFNIELYNAKDDFKNYSVNPLEDKNILLDIWMWNKIYRKSFIDKYNIRCLNILFEDVYFILECYFNNNSNVKFLPNYCGYYHVIHDYSNEKSLSYDFDENNLVKLIDGLKFNIDYIKNSNYEFVLPNIVCHCLIAIFVIVIEYNFIPKKVANYVIDISDYAGVELNFDEKWAQMFYNTCIKRKYWLINLFYKILSVYFTSDFLKKLHRNKL